MNQLPNKKDDALSSLIKSNNMLEPVSDQFTAGVLAKLGLELTPPKVVYEPVISKTGWILISVISTIIVALAMFGTTSEAISPAAATFDLYMRQAGSWFDALANNLSILIISILSLTVFLLVGVESVYRRSRLKAA